MQKFYCKITIATFMQPLRLIMFSRKDNNIKHAAVAPRNLDAATTMRFADTALQNRIQLHTAAPKYTAPKPDLDAKAEKRTILKAF